MIDIDPSRVIPKDGDNPYSHHPGFSATGCQNRITVKYTRRMFGPNRSWQADSVITGEFTSHCAFLLFVIDEQEKGRCIFNESVIKG